VNAQCLEHDASHNKSAMKLAASFIMQRFLATSSLAVISLLLHLYVEAANKKRLSGCKILATERRLLSSTNYLQQLRLQPGHHMPAAEWKHGREGLKPLSQLQ